MSFVFLRRGARYHGVLALVGLSLSLTGCSLFQDEFADAVCPKSDIVKDIAHVSRFQGRGTGFSDLAFQASLQDLSGGCTFDKGGVTVELTLSTLAQIGPAATSRSADFPYFVAIVDEHDSIIAKKVLSNTIAFAANQSRAGAQDTVKERLPLEDPLTASKYRVVVGFQLSAAERDYNRKTE